MLISISGEVEQAVIKRIEGIYNQLDAGEPQYMNKYYPQVVIVPNIERTVVVSNTAQSDIIMLLPYDGTLNTLPYYSIINSYLGVMPNSLLFDVLRNQQGYVYTVRSVLYENAGHKFWLITLGTDFNKAKDAKAATIDIIKGLGRSDQGIIAELNLARQWLVYNNLNRFVTNEAIASTLNYLQMQGYTQDTFVKSARSYESFDNIEIIKILQNNFSNPNITVVRTVNK